MIEYRERERETSNKGDYEIGMECVVDKVDDILSNLSYFILKSLDWSEVEFSATPFFRIKHPRRLTIPELASNFLFTQSY